MEIQGYPDYLIYEDGRVWAKKTKGRKEGFKKSTPSRDGYHITSLTNQYGPKTFRIHRLIAIHYIPNPNNLSFVDHIDRNPLNNNISNLRWVTSSENNQNRGVSKNNKCGIKNICYNKSRNNWRYEKTIRGKKFEFINKNKNIVLWCKFVHYLIKPATLRRCL